MSHDRKRVLKYESQTSGVIKISSPVKLQK